MVNYFDVLNVSENAEPEVIKASYKTLAKKYHPDSYAGDKEDAERKMALINEAYQTLSDERLRKQYLQRLKADRSYKNKHDDDVESYSKTYDEATSVYNNFNHARDEFKEYYDEKYAERVDKVAKFIRIVIVLVAIISIVSCIYYFGPELWNEFWEM